MATVREIEAAVTQLPREDFHRLLAWMMEFEQDQWDKQIEADSAAGKLDRFADQAVRDFQEGKCRAL